MGRGGVTGTHSYLSSQSQSQTMSTAAGRETLMAAPGHPRAQRDSQGPTLGPPEQANRHSPSHLPAGHKYFHFAASPGSLPTSPSVLRKLLQIHRSLPKKLTRARRRGGAEGLVGPISPHSQQVARTCLPGGRGPDCPKRPNRRVTLLSAANCSQHCSWDMAWPPVGPLEGALPHDLGRWAGRRLRSQPGCICMLV